MPFHALPCHAAHAHAMPPVLSHSHNFASRDPPAAADVHRMTSHTTTTAARLATLQRIRTSQDWHRIPRCDRLQLLQELRELCRLQLTPETTIMYASRSVSTTPTERRHTMRRLKPLSRILFDRQTAMYEGEQIQCFNGAEIIAALAICAIVFAAAFTYAAAAVYAMEAAR